MDFVSHSPNDFRLWFTDSTETERNNWKSGPGSNATRRKTPRVARTFGASRVKQRTRGLRTELFPVRAPPRENWSRVTRSRSFTSAEFCERIRPPRASLCRWEGTYVANGFDGEGRQSRCERVPDSLVKYASQNDEGACK